MTNEEQILQELKELKERREQRNRGGRRSGVYGHRSDSMENRSQGAKTFRRKRALSFLENLETKRETLKSQLETPELQSINQLLVGELKATETIISEFVQAFELFTTVDEKSNESTNDNQNN